MTNNLTSSWAGIFWTRGFSSLWGWKSLALGNSGPPETGHSLGLLTVRKPFLTWSWTLLLLWDCYPILVVLPSGDNPSKSLPQDKSFHRLEDGCHPEAFSSPAWVFKQGLLLFLTGLGFQTPYLSTSTPLFLRQSLGIPKGESRELSFMAHVCSTF